jgi:hypothetical protein
MQQNHLKESEKAEEQEEEKLEKLENYPEHHLKKKKRIFPRKKG